MSKIIDSHFHIWEIETIPLNWLSTNARLNRNFVFEDLEKAYKNLLFVGGLYIESASEDFAKEMEFISKQNNPKILGVCVADEKYLCEAKSFREILHIQGAKRSLQKDFLENLEKLFCLNLPFEACMKTEEICSLKNLLLAFPKLKIILNHMGNPNKEYFLAYQEEIKVLSRYSNLYVKLSPPDDFSRDTSWEFIVEIFRCLLQGFGEDRIIFGSNFPVSLLQPMEWIERIQKSRVFKNPAKIFYQNAMGFYKLKL